MRGSYRGGRRARAGRRWRVPAGAVAVVAVLAACSLQPGDSRGGNGAGPDASPSASGSPPADRPQLARFYGQQLSWSACGDNQCAELSVPVDYASPDGETLQLALLRVPARNSDQRLGSLVVNPGGPGASGTEYASYADQIVGSEVRRRFDVVGFDPRGVGRSRPVDCLTDAQLDEFLGGDPTPDTPAEQKQFVAGSTALAAGCQANSPTMLPHVSTLDAVQDMDVLREALGEQTLNFLGKSYGTYLGTVYAEQFPATVGRFVLDGVLPPDLTSEQLGEGQAAGFELATRAYVEDCVTRSGCPVGSSVEEGMEWIRAFLKQVDAQPLTVSNDARVTQLTEGWASMGIGLALYDQGLWSTLTRALEDAVGGDGNGLMTLANLYAERSSNGRYTGNLMEAIYAVNCSDRPDTADLSQVEANAEAFRAEAPTWGTFLAWGSVVCGVWPVPAEPGPRTIAAEGANTIVLVGTTRDPATPYEWARQLHDQLADAVLITYDGDGHTAYTRSNACVDKPIDEFFLTGTVPKDGLRC